MVSLMVWLIAFLATYFAIPLIRRLALRLDVLDYPGGRKIHKDVTPLWGGLGIYTGLIIALLFAAPVSQLKALLPMVIGATVIVITGVIEDKSRLRAGVRFIIQLIVSLWLIFSGLRISFLPPTVWGNAIEIFLSILWIVGLINAYNYLDGMDGLAAGSAVINLFFFSVILYTTSQYHLSLLSIGLIGACLAFLPYNFSKTSKIFLGETGSTLLGYILACIGLQGSWAGDNIVKTSIPIMILGVPIFDMIFTTIVRIREEKVKNIVEWLEYAGKDHFHHYLVEVGLRPKAAVVFIYFITISLGISAVMVSNDKAIEGILTIYQAAIIFGIIATLMVVGKRRKSGWIK